MGISIQKANLISMWTETMLFGAYSVLVVVTMTIFVRQSGRRVWRRPIMYITLLMYILSASVIVMVLVQNLDAFIEVDASNASRSAAFSRSSSILATEVFMIIINCILADFIFIWRVWIVWSRNFWVASIPASLLLATTTTGLMWARSFVTAPDVASIFTGDVGLFSYPTAATILATNLLCTSLIAGRIWYMQRKIWKGIGDKSMIKTGRTYRVITLIIIESGTLYSAVWLAIILTRALNTNGAYIVFDMASQLTGIVPTTIILLSHLRLSVGTEIENKYVSTMKFNTSPSARGPNSHTRRMTDTRITQSSRYVISTLDESDAESGFGTTDTAHKGNPQLKTWTDVERTVEDPDTYKLTPLNQDAGGEATEYSREV